jgi:hypothetical protein
MGRGICPFNRSVLEVLRANNSLDQLEEGVGIAQDENLPKSRKACTRETRGGTNANKSNS